MPEEKTTRGFHRVMRRLDVTLFTVCAILVIDQLAAAAAIGTSAMFWWIFTLIFFFVPYALISADPVLITEAESLGVDRVHGTLPRNAGDRLAASYVNFYTCNGGVIVPLFDDPHDDAALETLARVHPERRVVGVAAEEILPGGGNIHCITQQQPAARRWT